METVHGLVFCLQYQLCETFFLDLLWGSRSFSNSVWNCKSLTFQVPSVWFTALLSDVSMFFNYFCSSIKHQILHNLSQCVFFFGVWDCKEKVQIFLISLWVDFSCVLAAFSNYGNTEGEPQIQWMNEWMNDNQSLCSESLLNFRYEVAGSRYFGSHFSYL